MSETPSAMPPTYMTGWVYVLENESMPNLFKVGFTGKTVEARLAELSSATGVPTSFVCVFYCRVKNPRSVEHASHDILSSYRLGRDREFFKADFATVVDAIRLAASNLRERLYDEWEHPSHKRSKQTHAISTYQSSSPSPQERKVGEPPLLTPPIMRNPTTTVGQLTPSVVRSGKASVSLVWVPLKGHQNERK